jgi:endonuclease/exonuclease/phosphatase family metal-dependent hydrolase
VCKRFGWASLAVVATLVAFAVPAAAQTVTLPAADAVLRAGVYVNTNFGSGDLETKASIDPDYLRHAVLKFNTQTEIPAGSPITSATLTLTVHSGSSPLRHLAVYCVPSTFNQTEVTWNSRSSAKAWSTPGGDVGHQHGVATVTNVAGSKVAIDVTAIVQEAMQGATQTRVLLADIDGTDAPSYMAYYSNEAGSASLRPTLVVNYGNPIAPPPPLPPLSTTGTTLKVLQWNVQQGHKTNGTSNIDSVVDWVFKMDPDVISFNEIMHYESYSADMVRLIADKLKARTGQTWNWKWVRKCSSTNEGEAVMSRLPFEATAEYQLSYCRSVAEAMVMVNNRPINVFSTHLDAPKADTSIRLQQISELKHFASSLVQQRIIMGDFNSWPGTSEYANMCKDHKDSWAVAAGLGTAVAYADNPNGNTRNSRIDYVWYSTGATLLELKGARVYDTRDASGVKPSDHNPLVATFVVK